MPGKESWQMKIGVSSDADDDIEREWEFWRDV
jgi:hypothetical protein